MKEEKEIWLNRLFRRFLQSVLKGKTSKPFISGDFFSSIAQAKVIDANCRVEDVAKAKVVFVKGDFLNYHLLNNVNLFADKIVISGNSDQNFPELPPNVEKLSMLMCQNLVHGGNKKCRTIPIGIENIALAGSGFRRYHRVSRKKMIQDKVLVPPMGNTNSARSRVLEEAKKLPDIFEVAENRLSRKNYFELTKRYKFILVLEGNGYDTHRLWEVLYQGSFPVVFNTDWISDLDYLGLPIFKIDLLSDISKKSLIDFANLHLEFDPRYHESLWSDYWERVVNGGSH